MFPSISLREIIIVLVIFLLLFGHKKIRSFGKSLGEGLRDFKKGLEGKSEDTAETPTSPDQKESTTSGEASTPPKEESTTSTSLNNEKTE